MLSLQDSTSLSAPCCLSISLNSPLTVCEIQLFLTVLLSCLSSSHCFICWVVCHVITSNYWHSVSHEPTHPVCVPRAADICLVKDRLKWNAQNKGISVALNKLVLEPISLLMLRFQEHWPSALTDSHVGLMVGNPCSGMFKTYSQK